MRRLLISGAEVCVFEGPKEASEAAVDRIFAAIRSAVEGRVVLGLATGATPELVYQRIGDRHRSEGISFGKVTTFNLDEYYPMSPFDPNSYRAYMHRHLFSRIDLPSNQGHVLDGTVPESFATQHAQDFDSWIADIGPIDLQLLGLGRNGHIGFNEPTALPVEQALALPTRLVELHPVTVEDAAKDFGDVRGVPRRALTMGIRTIMAARSIIVLAFGAKKAEAVKRSLTGPITAEVPGSLLQTVPGKVTWLLDREAAAEIL